MLKLRSLRKKELWLFVVLVSSNANARNYADAQATAQKATEMIQRGEFSHAQQVLEEELHQFSGEIALWNLLGIARTESGQTVKAHEAFEQGLKLAPRSVSLNENTGLLFFKEADYPNAKKYLRRAIELGSENPGARFSLAASQLRTGETTKAREALKLLETPLGASSAYWEERGRAEMLTDAPAAESDFTRALELAPNSAAAFNGAASAAEKQGLDEKALAYLIRAKQANPDDVSTLAHFGTVCIRRDLGMDAKEALEKAHELDPSNSTVLFLLARSNISLQNWQNALDLFAEFARRMPNFAPTYYAMAWIDLKLNQQDHARKLLERCLQLQPGLTDARVELAQLLFDNGQLPEAEKQVRTALQEDPNHAKGNQLLGDLLLRHGKVDEAQMHMEEAVKADPQSSAAHYKLAMILSRKHESERAAQERMLAGTLAEENKRESKTQLRLVLPESRTVQ